MLNKTVTSPAGRLLAMLAVVVALVFGTAMAAPAHADAATRTEATLAAAPLASAPLAPAGALAAVSGHSGLSVAGLAVSRLPGSSLTAPRLLDRPSDPSAPTGEDNSVCKPASTQNPADSTLLSINRWGTVADSFHDRLDASFLSDIFEKIQRRLLFSTMNSFGNSAWQLTSSLTGFATRFCLIDVVGPDADTMSAGLGNAFSSSGLIAGILAAGVGLILWRTARGAGNLKSLIRPVGVFSMILLFTIGASGSTLAGPGTGSPWWFAAKTDKIVSNLAAAPLKALSTGSGGVGNIGVGGGTQPTYNQGRTSCINYLKNMSQEYQGLFGHGLDNLSVQMPLVMSQMWENTGLSVWVRTQFGTENTYGQKVFCYVLDDRVNQPVGRADDKPATDARTGGTRIGMLDAGIPKIDPGSYALNTANDGLLLDSAVVGIAACTWDGKAWSVDPGWANMKSGGKAGGGGTPSSNENDKVNASDCEKLWTTQTKRNVDDFQNMHMTYQDDPSFITAEAIKSGSPAAGNFLLNWHGNENSAAFVLAITFDLAAVIMLLVFGGIALGIIIAKTIAVIMIVLVILAALASLWPGSGTSRLAQYIKLYLGITVFVFGVSALYALISLVTGYLNKAAANLFDAGSLLSILWSGFAPVTAVILLHMVFKHALKMPSPFKLSGGLAWAGAGAGIGAAAGVGLDRISQGAKARAKKFAGGGLRGSFQSLRRKPGANTSVKGNGGSSQKMQASDMAPKIDHTTPKPVAKVPVSGQGVSGPATSGPNAPSEDARSAVESAAAVAASNGASAIAAGTATGKNLSGKNVPGKNSTGQAGSGQADGALAENGEVGAGPAGDFAGDPQRRELVDPVVDPLAARREELAERTQKLTDRSTARTGKHLKQGVTAGKLNTAADNAKAGLANARLGANSGLFRDRLRLAAAGVNTAGAVVDSRLFNTVSRRARFRLSEASAPFRRRLANTKALGADRARYALAWAKAHPAKAVLAVGGGVIGAAALPLTAVAGAAVAGVGVLGAGAVANPVIAGAVAAAMVRRHHKNQARNDPEARSRRQAQREALYARAAAQNKLQVPTSNGQVVTSVDGSRNGAVGARAATNEPPVDGSPSGEPMSNGQPDKGMRTTEPVDPGQSETNRIARSTNGAAPSSDLGAKTRNSTSRPVGDSTDRAQRSRGQAYGTPSLDRQPPTMNGLAYPRVATGDDENFPGSTQAATTAHTGSAPAKPAASAKPAATVQSEQRQKIAEKIRSQAGVSTRGSAPEVRWAGVIDSSGSSPAAPVAPIGTRVTPRRASTPTRPRGIPTQPKGIPDRPGNIADRNNGRSGQPGSEPPPENGASR